MNIGLLNWNVRGLNSPARRRAIQNICNTLSCNIVCLQETKIADLSRSLVMETLGSRFGDNFLFKGADGTRGGILIACTNDFAIVPMPSASNGFSLSAILTDRSDGSSWTLTVVYGPQEDQDKLMFLQELRDLKLLGQNEWMIAGDFNLIARTDEKNNSNINIGMMGRFRSVIEDLELREFQLIGRNFTWASENSHHTCSKLDRSRLKYV